MGGGPACGGVNEVSGTGLGTARTARPHEPQPPPPPPHPTPHSPPQGARRTPTPTPTPQPHNHTAHRRDLDVDDVAKAGKRAPQLLLAHVPAQPADEQRRVCRVKVCRGAGRHAGRQSALAASFCLEDFYCNNSCSSSSHSYSGAATHAAAAARRSTAHSALNAAHPRGGAPAPPRPWWCWRSSWQWPETRGWGGWTGSARSSLSALCRARPPGCSAGGRGGRCRQQGVSRRGAAVVGRHSSHWKRLADSVSRALPHAPSLLKTPHPSPIPESPPPHTHTAGHTPHPHTAHLKRTNP